MELLSIPTIIFWLQLNVYHEAKFQPIDGQVAVVHVVLERVQRRNLSVKEVILQSKQFSWVNANGLKNKKIDNYPRFIACGRAVMLALKERLNGQTRGHIDHYFNPELALPSWAKHMTLIDKIRDHNFYRSN